MRQGLIAFGFRLIAVAGTALVLQFFSEFYFLNEGPSGNVAKGWAALPGLMISTYVYALFAYIFLIVVDRFAVRSLAGLLLAGSIFGWATEALVVPVVYEAPPVSFIWPSVGWHALVDVMAGWYLLRLAMRRLAWPWLALLFAGLGVAWAFWASWTWSVTDEAPVVYTTNQFWNIVLVTGVSWIVGTLLADIGATRAFRASWWESGAVGGFALVLFVTTGLPYFPWLAALAIVVLITLGALAWARRGAGQGRDRLAPLSERPALAAYLAMPILPLASGLTYPVVLENGLSVPAEHIVALLFLAGALGFAGALVRSALEGRAT